MPIARGKYRQPLPGEALDITVQNRYHLFSARYRQAAAGQEIILQIHYNQGVAFR
jgi:hypothetical protein